MIGDVIDPITKQHYERDPRWIAKKAELYLQNTGVGDTAYLRRGSGVFHLRQRSLRPERSTPASTSSMPKRAAGIRAAERDNLGYRPRYKEGYFPVPPTDHYQDLRSEMVQTMIKCGLNIECHHHEVATGGQCEIDQRFDTLVKSADNMMLYKYIIRNVANQYGKTVTFMPKPLFRRQRQRHAHPPEHLERRQAAVRRRRLRGLEPDGAVVHRRAAEARARAFGDHRADDQQLQAAGAGLRSAGEPGLLAAQSFGGVPHSDVFGESEGQARRVPAAGSVGESVPGVRGHADGGPGRRANKIEPGEPLDKDIYDLSPEEMKNVPSMPASLDEALQSDLQLRCAGRLWPGGF